MTITQAQIEGYRKSWFPPGMTGEERRISAWGFAKALMQGSLTASERDERAELFRRVVAPDSGAATIRAHVQPFTSRTNLVTKYETHSTSLQAEIGRAIDGALARQTDRARATLRTSIAAAERAAGNRQAAESRALAARKAAESRALAAQINEDRALAASLGAAAERAHQLSLTPLGPIRIPIRTW